MAEKKCVSSLISKCKTQYYRNELQKKKGDISGTWKVVHSMNSQSNSNFQTDDADALVVKADEFNEYFANIGKRSFEKSQKNFTDSFMYEDNDRSLTNNVMTTFRPQPLNIDTVILTVKQLKDTNAVGSDGIPFHYIRDALPVVIFYIMIIINTSIVTGTYPSAWKLPYVVPFFKAGDRDDISNYRPISLLPILSKNLERIVANQLTAYLESNGLLANNQHGFRTNLSTETALLKVTEKLYENMDRQKYLSLCCSISLRYSMV